MIWSDNKKATPTGKKVEEGFSYSSDNNAEWLTVEQIKELLKDVHLEQ